MAGRDDLIDSYLDAIEIELSWLGEPRNIDTLFIGGGTPTHLTVPQLHRLMQITLTCFQLEDGHEFSIEANPVDIDLQRLAVLHEYGVTRLSIGAQSFDEAKLARLERDHGPQQIRRSVETARPFVGTISLDLIFGVPGESVQTWNDDLDQALALAPDHLSTYGLTLERGTSFWTQQHKGRLTPPSEEVQRRMYLDAIDQLTDAGFEHYEVSNFAQPGRCCRHNEAYWQCRPYFAAGPGASRFIDGKRETNHRSTTAYLKRMHSGQSPVAEAEQLGPEESARERLVFGMRRLMGVDVDQFKRETGFSVQQLGGRHLDQLLELNLLESTGDQLRLTRDGLLVSDSMWTKLLNP